MKITTQNTAVTKIKLNIAKCADKHTKTRLDEQNGNTKKNLLKKPKALQNLT